MHQRPTSVRYLIVAAATLMSFLLYIDRFCVNFAQDLISQDFGLTNAQFSWFTSAFFWSYALAQVPSGWLSDRYGARLVLAAYIVTWSIFTALIGAANGFLILIVARLGCGLGQAGAYPTAAAVIARWMPVSARGVASSFVANGGRIGGALAPPLTAYLIVAFVPLGTPVEIQPDDIIAPHNVIERLSTALSGKLAAAESADLDQLRTAFEHAPQDGTQVKRLAAFMNGLLDSDQLLDIARTDRRLKLPSESLATLRRINQQAPVSDAETRRLKRFTLEALLPNALKKLYRLGWRPIIILYGVAGLGVAVFFWLVFRERPEQHAWANQAEIELIQAGRPAVPQSSADKQGIPFTHLLHSGNMWANSLMQFGTNIGWLFIMVSLPNYLLQVHQVPIIERGYMTMIPPLVGIAGMFMGGKLTDVWMRRLGLKWGRRLPILGSRITAVLAYLGCIGLSFLPSDSPLNSPWTITALCALVAFSTDFGAPPTWAFCQDVGGRHVGSVLGWGNMWGNIGAAVAPKLYDVFLGEAPTTANWNHMFLACAVAFALSGVCSIVIDATKPVVQEHT